MVLHFVLEIRGGCDRNLGKLTSSYESTLSSQSHVGSHFLNKFTMIFRGGEEDGRRVALIVDSESAQGMVSGSMQHIRYLTTA